MTDEEFMREAIKAAKEAEAGGGLPLAAVLVKDGRILARAKSIPWEQRDTTNHAEIDCIRAATQEMGIKDFSDCTLYGIIEPCSMCFGACLWAGVERVVFGAYATDIENNPYEYDNYSSTELAKSARKHASPNGKRIKVMGGVLRDECMALLRVYKGWVKQ